MRRSSRSSPTRPRSGLRVGRRHAQTLSVEIAYEGSVVLAALSRSRRSVVRVLSVTLSSDVYSGVVEAFREASTSPENRALAGMQHTHQSAFHSARMLG